MVQTATKRQRADLLLVEAGLAESREQARVLIEAGLVLADGQPVAGPSVLLRPGVVLELRSRPRYVGRGGEKLEHALRHWGVPVQGAVVADVGASTGGFTDCLLQHGAARVYAIDVGYGQLHPKLRSDPRVVVMERTNARYLERLPEQVDGATVDLSFISATKVLPAVAGWLRPSGWVVLLLKPQFELEPRLVRKGVVRDPRLHAVAIGRFLRWAMEHRFRLRGLLASPLLGAEGNREFLLWLMPARA
jgi:23S rRNA (cytidine1920-2'-O)/16S rRNA (cytidine1409-2'-O)-methyltransferase